MSKFLKFIVNLFLICAILVAAAIIVPPLVGVETTVVDTQLMDTNLPMGSVTYSKDVYLTELKEGDRILDESDLSTYVYTVRTADTSTGSVKVADAFDASAEEKEIRILNNASKVILTIPYIGYVVYAMHSIEGIIILALAVLLIIILFILSELWRRDDDDDEDDDEYEDDEDDEEEEPSVRVSEPESLDLENEVDIKPYMNQEEEPAAEEVPTEEEAPAAPEEVPAFTAEPASAEEAENAGEPAPEETLTEAAETEAEAPDAAKAQPAAGETVAEEAADTSAAEDADAGVDMDFLEKELEAALEENTAGQTEQPGAEAGTQPEASYEENAAPQPHADAEEMPEAANENEGIDETLEEAAEKIVEETPQEAVYDERRYLEEVSAEESADPEADTFIPIARPTLDTIMKGAERSGEEPVVIKEPVTGLTYVDYSDIL